MEKREAEEFSKNILENSNKMNKNACVKSWNYNSNYISMVKSGTVLVKQGRLECLLIPTTTSRSVSASWALLNLFDLNLYFLTWNITTYLRILLSLGIRQKTFLSRILLVSALFSDAHISTRKKMVLLCSCNWSCFHILTLANLYYKVNEIFTI